MQTEEIGTDGRKRIQRRYEGGGLGRRVMEQKEAVLWARKLRE